MKTITELKQVPQWVGHQNKIPKDPHTGHNASSINPSTWSNAASAWQAKSRYRWDGIGFVFTIGSGVVGVDLDKCFIRDELNVRHLKPWARDVVHCLNSYTEVSPSGQGLHILCRGKIPFSINRSERGFEMYNEARYFTVTGKIFAPLAVDEGYASGAIEERQDELAALHAVFNEEPSEPQLAETRPYQKGNVSATQIKDALAVLPLHMAYPDWLTVCMAVHDAFPDSEGISLIEGWSPGYKGEVAGKFKSFDRTAKNGISVASLFHLAKQHGYTAPKKHYTQKLTSAEKSAALMTGTSNAKRNGKLYTLAT